MRTCIFTQLSPKIGPPDWNCRLSSSSQRSNGMLGKWGGVEKREDRVPGLPMCRSHIPRSLVSSERTRRHEGAAPRHPCYSATRRCVIVEAARAGLIWDTFEVWRIFASAREFKPTLLREMGFFNLRPIYFFSFLPFGYTCFHSRLR